MYCTLISTASRAGSGHQVSLYGSWRDGWRRSFGVGCLLLLALLRLSCLDLSTSIVDKTQDGAKDTRAVERG